MKKNKSLIKKIVMGVVCGLLGLVLAIFVGEKFVFASFFFGGAKAEMIIPGLWQDFVPQGFDKLESGEYLMAGYAKDGVSPSIVYVVNGKDKNRYELYNKDGSAYTSHAGGITHFNNYVYIANDTHEDTTYLDMFLLSDMLDKDGKATLLDSIPVPNRLAYCSVYDGKMYTGAFTATADKEDGLEYKNYYDTVRELALTDAFPHSVWNDKGQTDPTYTLYGEFWGDSEDGNRFKVENGNLKQTFGSLTMFYEDISSYDVASSSVWIERASDDKMDSKVYKYNSATSQFFISLSTGQTSSNMYCTFATLKNDSALEDFQEALADYIEDNYDEDESFTTSRTVTLNTDDAFVGSYGLQKTYDVPKEPIIIKYVKVSKY
jgi:hypothetical protein